MTEKTMVPADTPLAKAWKAYKETEGYASTCAWAAHSKHVDGAVWAAFVAGFLAAQRADTERADTEENDGE